MTDKQGIIFVAISGYATFIFCSVIVLTGTVEEFDRNPELINTKWKRALWVLSCLLMLPFLIVLSRGPRSLFGEIRDFIVVGNAGANANEQDKQVSGGEH